MKYIKSHKKEFIVLFLAVLILLISLISFLVVWFQGSSNKYGDRLNGIEDVIISEDHINDILSKLKENELVTNTEYSFFGRLLSIHVYTSHDSNKDELKKLGDIVISNMEEKELKFYDVQLFIIFDNEAVEEENKINPILGYKHKTSEGFVWSNN